MLTAYIDESQHVTGVGVYVVAAVVILDDEAQQIRDQVRSATPRGRRFHWRTEERRERDNMLNILAALPPQSVRAYAAQPCPSDKTERARRKCIESLLLDIHGSDVRALVLESRQERNDKRDREVLAHFARIGLVAGEVTYRHERPQAEPLLWAADAVAGVVSASRIGRGEHYWESIRGTVALGEVSP